MKFGYLHTRMNADIAREINAINHILATVPFRNTSAPLPYFLDTYKLQYEDMVPINDANKFPIEPNKLLKLGISLGNLIKTLKLDEEMHQEQQQRQSLFIASLNNSVSRHPSVNHSLASIKSPVSGYYDPYDPFHGERQSSTVTNSANNQSLQHVKFVKNLLLLLKNFDIGTTTSAGTKLHELSSKASNLSLTHQTQLTSTLDRKVGDQYISRRAIYLQNHHAIGAFYLRYPPVAYSRCRLEFFHRRQKQYHGELVYFFEQLAQFVQRLDFVC